MPDSTLIDMGLDLFEEDIDEIIFSTNAFLTNATNTGTQGGFWWVLQISMALSALFCIFFAAGLAWKMMVKHEELDILKLLRPLAISLVLSFWYPGTHPSAVTAEGSHHNWCVLDFFAFIPNAIGSWCHELYGAETEQVKSSYSRLCYFLKQRDDGWKKAYAQVKNAESVVTEKDSREVIEEALPDADSADGTATTAIKLWFENMSAGVIVGLDKIILFLALLLYRVGWWTTIYGQQILLGMLTIFGPIQWAFSILPKWEGAWAKWISRYLTVQFYGAALYFVGFYVLLLFDICLNIQISNLTPLATEAGMAAYIKNAFLSSGYMLVASIVALKCLNFVPDIASWMVPEGDTAFSTRQFGEGVASSLRQGTTAALSKIV